MYTPEIERYGGTKAINHAHNIFHISSLFGGEFIKKSRTSCPLSAANSTTILLNNLGLSKKEISEVLMFLSTWYFKKAGLNNNDFKALSSHSDSKYKNVKKLVQDNDSIKNTKKLEMFKKYKINESAEFYIRLKKQLHFSNKWLSIMGSIAHMHFNRCNISNEDEAINAYIFSSNYCRL
jgi:thiopeptide-type bacteriocin biosynthesis protein